MTFRDVRLVQPVNIGAPAVTQLLLPGFLNANGFSQYSATGSLLAFQLPQEGQFDRYASLYRYYVPEYISLSYHGSNVKIDANAANALQDVFILQTMMGTLPTSDTLNTFTPAATAGDITLRYR